MNVRDALLGLASSSGRLVSVRGPLLVGADSRLVFDEHSCERDVILLPHETTERALLMKVPAYGGGRYLYWDEAVVTGEIADDPPRFVSLESIVIERTDTSYQVTNLRM